MCLWGVYPLSGIRTRILSAWLGDAFLGAWAALVKLVLRHFQATDQHTLQVNANNPKA